MSTSSRPSAPSETTPSPLELGKNLKNLPKVWTTDTVRYDECSFVHLHRLRVTCKSVFSVG